MAKTKAHNWVLWKELSRRVCACCGLLELRNAASRAAAAGPCRWTE